MEGSSWITLLRKDSPALSVDSQVYNILLYQASNIPLNPSIITFIGRREKSILLREILGGTTSKYPQEYHNQIHLWANPRTRTTTQPILLADYKLQGHSASQWTTPAPVTGPNSFRKVTWTDHTKKEDIATLILARILSPLSTVICLFAPDLNGIRGVAQLLATQLQMTIAHGLSFSVRPHVVVVINSSSKQANVLQAEMKLTSLLKRLLFLTGLYSAEVDMDTLINSHFKSIHVLPLYSATTVSA